MAAAPAPICAMAHVVEASRTSDTRALSRRSAPALASRAGTGEVTPPNVIRTMYLVSELSGLEGYDQQTGLAADMENVDDATSVYDCAREPLTDAMRGPDRKVGTP